MSRNRLTVPQKALLERLYRAGGVDTVPGSRRRADRLIAIGYVLRSPTDPERYKLTVAGWRFGETGERI